MKFLIALLILIPTLIAALLFTVAGMLSFSKTISVLCIIAGIVCVLPLVAVIVFGIYSLFSGKKPKGKV